MTTAIAVWGLTYLIHSTVLIVFAAIVSRLTTSSALRDVLWKTALVGAIFTASLQSLIPQIPSVQIEAPIADTRGAGASGPRVSTNPVPQTASPILQHPTETNYELEVTAPAPVVRSITMVGAAIGAWMLVSMVLLTRVVLARRRLLKLLAPTTPVDDAEAVAIVEELRGDARLAPVTLSESAVSLSPFATHRREICVPVGFFAELSAARKRALLAHEIAHIARRDPQWLLLSEIVKAIFFFQPLNAIAQRQMRDASEFLCDDFAVVSTGMRRELAESLAGLAEVVRGAALPLPAMAEGRSRLVERVARLLSDRKPELSLAPRFRIAIAVSLAAMMVFLAPVVAAVDRTVPKPPPPPAPAPTRATAAIHPAPPPPAVRATPSIPPAPHVAPVAPGANVVPVIGPEGIVYAPYAEGPAVLAGAPAPAMPPSPPHSPVPQVTPAVAPTPAPAIEQSPAAPAARHPVIAPAPPPAVKYSTGADPYASATASGDGHYGKISLVQSDDHKSTHLEGRNVTISDRATKIAFSDQRGYLRVTQQWKSGEKRQVEVLPSGATNKYTYRVNGSERPWSAAAERIILDAFGNGPKKPMTPKPAAASSAPSSSGSSVVPGNARVAVAPFGGCLPGVSWETRPGRPRNAGARAHSAPEGAPAHTTWEAFSKPLPMNYGKADENSPCSGAGRSATLAYIRALGERSVALKAPVTVGAEQRLRRLIAAARDKGAQYVLDGNVVAVEPAGEVIRYKPLVRVRVETRLIRVADGVIVERRRDEARGTADVNGVYQTLARRLETALKTANS